MAKTLAERIKSAKSTDRINDTDLKALIADASAECERLARAAVHHEAESIDFALSDEDRNEASRLADQYQRTSRGLANEVEILRQKLEEKQNSEKRKAEEARIAAIIARRDALAARLKERIPALFAELVSMFEEIEASDAELAAEQIREPSAEAVARGVPGNFYTAAGTPISRLTKVKLPGDDGHNLWPRRHDPGAIADAAYRSQLLLNKRLQEEENARWARYMVTGPDDDATMVETRRGYTPVGRGHRRSIDALMTAEGVKDAEANGCKVVPLRPNESVGMPMQAVI